MKERVPIGNAVHTIGIVNAGIETFDEGVPDVTSAIEPGVEGNFDQVLLLSPGEALRSGTPAEMLKPALLERAFNCPPDRHPVLVERAQMQSGRTA